MLYAINENNRKVTPQKGIRARCPICESEVLPVCGDINIHHWRHITTINCDPWKENETEWHRSWKEEFPEAWRETIIEKDGEKHIADIKTDKDLIVEFQNSSISNRTIQVREEFYKNMVWLINANTFKNNFSIRSLVKTHLGYIDDAFDQNNNYEKEIEDNLKPLKNEVKEYEKEIAAISFNLNRLEICSNTYNGYLNNIDNTVSEAIDKSSYDLLRHFTSENIETIRSNNLIIKILKDKAVDKTKQLSRIEVLPKTDLQNYTFYSIVSFDLVSPKSYLKCCVIKTDSLDTLFPDVIRLKSESNFNWYKNQKTNYLLIIDLTNDINILKAEIEQLQNEIKSVIDTLEQKRTILKKELVLWLNAKITETGNEILDHINKKTTIFDKICAVNLTIEAKRETQLVNAEKFREKQYQKKVNQSFQIKNKYKGLYSYYWNYRRKSWDYAECKLFIDFESHIFEILPNNIIRKATKIEFIDRIKNWR